MASTDVRYIIRVDDEGAIQKLKDLGVTVEGLAPKGKQAKSALEGLWKQFAVGNIAADAVRKGFSLLKNEIASCTKAAAESEAVDRSLESSLAIVGRTSKGTAESFKRYASELSRKTVYDDEAIKSAQALIIQMRGTTNQLDEVTRGAVGLASVFKMDLQSASRAVAQGFEGNYRQLGMLIPAIREAKTEGEKHAAMTKALGDAYKKAESETSTYSGAMAQLKNAYDNLKETVGGYVVQNTELIDSLNSLKSIVEWLDSNSGKLDIGKKLNLAPRFYPGASIAEGGKMLLNLLGGFAKSDLEAQANSWEAWTASMLRFRRDAIDPLPASLKVTTQYFETLHDRFAVLNDDLRILRSLGFTDASAAVKNATGSLGAMVGGGLGAAIDFKESAGEEFFSFLKKGEKATQKSTDKMADYFAGFYNDIANGFANAFMQINFTMQGFAKFFIGIWQSIKQAIFKIIAEIVARFLIFKVLFKLLGGAIPGFGNFMSGLGMPVAAASGFEGWVNRPTPMLVGEAGPEYVSVRPAGAAAGAGGGSISINFHAPMIATTGLSRADIEAAGTQLLAVVKSQLRRVGRTI